MPKIVDLRIPSDAALPRAKQRGERARTIWSGDSRQKDQKLGRCMQRSTFGWRRAVRQQGEPHKSRPLWGERNKRFFSLLPDGATFPPVGSFGGAASHSITLDRVSGCKFSLDRLEACGIETQCSRLLPESERILQYGIVGNCDGVFVMAGVDVDGIENGFRL